MYLYYFTQLFFFIFSFIDTGSNLANATTQFKNHVQLSKIKCSLPSIKLITQLFILTSPFKLFLKFFLIILLYIYNDTKTKLTFRNIRFSDIKKISLIYFFSVIIIGFYFNFHYKGI